MNIKLIVSGCLGRMGRSISKIAFSDPELEFIAGIESADSRHLGSDLGSIILGEERNVPITSKLKDYIASTDLIIDFSSPQATLSNLKIASDYNKSVVIGTTGFSQKDLKEIDSISKDIAILISPYLILFLS
jgi:4-hydroxy-tetrahydrodipicolinate reductase